MIRFNFTSMNNICKNAKALAKEELKETKNEIELDEENNEDKINKKKNNKKGKKSDDNKMLLSKKRRKAK